MLGCSVWHIMYLRFSEEMYYFCLRKRCRQVMPSSVIGDPAQSGNLLHSAICKFPNRTLLLFYSALKARRGIVISAFRMVVASPV